MIIYVVRHGETALNAARVVQLPDTPLNPRGAQQARRVADRLAAAGVRRVLTSDLRRALMTADAVHARVGGTLTVTPTLQERHFGDLRGRAYSDFAEDIFGPTFAPPGGETWDVFHVRVEQAWREILAAAASGEGDLAVITHGLVCRALAARHLRLPAGVEVPQHWGNTCVTEIEAAEPWPVRVLNCTSHLTDDSSDDNDAPTGL
jgi:probable phosphoglycerate mutase